MTGEFELIEAFLEPFPRGTGVTIGPGSDCAAVTVRKGMQLVATTDAVVEGVHFDLRRFSPEDVGWKALAVNLSDLAAAGARPRWFLCALGIPRTGRSGQIARRIARGMALLAKRFSCALIGGNVTRAGAWSLTITALGEARRPLSRKGARPGDVLVVAGVLGDAAAGLRPYPSPIAARAQRRPAPRIDEGLRAAGLASAAIDISDGFLQDLGHLCRESAVGAVVECSALPLGKAARALPDGMELALGGGEDYALLLSVPRRKLAALRRRVRFAEVGRVIPGRSVHLTELGQPRPFPRRLGFDHLK
ncbi:MAG TPA: thiamine-phosphate kinase [Myxococcales bacterium]|nr:thiamine-phosphate kinase [Myxococcales bacterium]